MPDSLMYVPSRKACLELGVHANTLRRWADEGKIRYIRTAGGKRLYDCSSVEQSSSTKKNYCYCRVSSSKQKDDLERQVSFMSERFPDHTILKDVGSGLNFKRKQLLFLLEECVMGRVGEVVVAYRDRLCRFGFELLEWFFSKNSVKLVVLEQQELSPQQELVADLLSVITVFSCRVHGLRKYRTAVKEDSSLPQQGTEEDSE